MGNRGVKTKPRAPATRLQAKRKPGQPRRTPQHIADPAGLCNTYDAEDIIAERMAKSDKGNSEKQWLVQWKGFPASAQTWEPLENLSGCEAFIARSNEEREANEQADLEKRMRTRDAQEEERQKKQKSESGTALLDSATSAPLQAQTGRRTSVAQRKWSRHRTVFPNLSRMARQYLATPATSAGVERLFSAAGLTFGDLAHAMKEETLGCRLLAAYNYTHALYCYP